MAGSKWYPYMILISEAALGSMLLCPVFMPSGDFAPVFYSFAILSVSAVLFLFLLHLAGERGSLLFFAAVLPLIFIAGALCGFSWFTLLFFCVLVFWRTQSVCRDPEGGSDGTRFMLVFAGGFAVILSAVFLDRAWIGKIVWMIVLQEAFIIAVGFFLKLDASGTSKGNKSLLVRDYAAAMLGILAVGGAAVLVIPIVSRMFFSAMQGIAYLFGAAASPFFKWAETRDWSTPVNEESQREEQQLDENPEQPIMEEPGQGFEIILTAAAAAGLIYVMYYLYKKRKVSSDEDMEEKELAYKVTGRSKGSKGGPVPRTKRAEAPADPVRREMHQLEVYSEKRKLGRRPYESFPEWMDRIGLHVDVRTSSIYEKVRYGEKLADPDEAAAFLERISTLKTEVKQLHLHLVKEGEISSGRFLGLLQKKQLKGRNPNI
jgi:hypothetical protein